MQTVSHFDGTAADNLGESHWAGREESSGGSSLTPMGCPVSGTQEDRELAATQTVLISSPSNDGHTLSKFKPDECLHKHSSGLWCLWCQYYFFSSLLSRSLLPIPNHAHQTCLIFVIQCWAVSQYPMRKSRPGSVSSQVLRPFTATCNMAAQNSLPRTDLTHILFALFVFFHANHNTSQKAAIICEMSPCNRHRGIVNGGCVVSR